MTCTFCHHHRRCHFCCRKISAAIGHFFRTHSLNVNFSYIYFSMTRKWVTHKVQSRVWLINDSFSQITKRNQICGSQIVIITDLWDCDIVIHNLWKKKCDFWDFTTFTILFYNSERNRNCQKTIKTFRKRDSIIFVSDLLRVVPCVVNDKFLNLVTNNFSSQTTVWQKKEKLSQKGRRKIKFVLLLIIKIRIA